MVVPGGWFMKARGEAAGPAVQTEGSHLTAFSAREFHHFLMENHEGLPVFLMRKPWNKPWTMERPLKHTPFANSPWVSQHFFRGVQASGPSFRHFQAQAPCEFTKNI